MGFKQNEMFPSKYLAAEDFQEGEQRVVTVKDVTSETFDNKRSGKQEKKFIVELRNEKPLILNKTNASVMFELLGDDTDLWLGKKVTLWVKIVDSFGEEKPAIRVKTVLPETDPYFRQPQPSAQPQAQYPASQFPNAQAYQQPNAKPEPYISAMQKSLILREAQRVYGGETSHAAQSVNAEFGKVNDMTYAQAEECISRLKSKPNYRAPVQDNDPFGESDDSDPFAD